MAAEADLASEGDIVADAGAAGDADLGAEDAVLANGHIVADLDEVVDFGAALNPSAAETGAVHSGVGADLDIIIDLHSAGLRDFLLFSVAELVSESIRPDHDSAVEDDAVADTAALADCDLRVKVAVFAERGLLPDKTLGFNHTVGSNFCSRFDDHMGADGASLADLRIWRNHCRRVDSRFANDGLGGKKRKNLGKCGRWIGNKKAVGWNLLLKRLGKKNRCGARLSERVDVFGVPEKGDVARIGIGQRCHIGNLDISRFRSKPGVDAPGEFTECH